jgi:scyllo-inositol 2-dehydrogenase (NADP+)
MTRVRIGLVGLGWVSTHRHLPALRANPLFDVVGVADRHDGLAATWARKLGLRHHVQASRIDDIPWLDEVDAIDVVTAPMSHHALIRDALLRGKHVLTEKPFAMTVAEGEELVALAARQQRVLAIVHNFQFASSMQRLLHDLDSGAIGAVRSIGAMQWGNPGRRLPTWYEELPAGLFFDESPHLLYLLRRLSPAPLQLRHVEGWPSTMGLRTPAAIDASFQADTPHGPIPLTLSCRFEAPLSEWHVSVAGDRAAGFVDVFRDIYIRLPNDGRHEAPQVLRTSWQATLQHWARHFVNGPLHLRGKLLYGNTTVVERFGRAVLEGGAPEGIAATDALAVLKLQHEIITRASAPRSTP